MKLHVRAAIDQPKSKIIFDAGLSSYEAAGNSDYQKEDAKNLYLFFMDVMPSGTFDYLREFMNGVHTVNEDEEED